MQRACAGFADLACETADGRHDGHDHFVRAEVHDLASSIDADNVAEIRWQTSADETHDGTGEIDGFAAGVRHGVDCADGFRAVREAERETARARASLFDPDDRSIEIAGGKIRETQPTRDGTFARINTREQRPITIRRDVGALREARAVRESSV